MMTAAQASRSDSLKTKIAAGQAVLAPGVYDAFSALVARQAVMRQVGEMAP